MISEKIASVSKLLTVLADPATLGVAPRQVLEMAARQLRDCAANVKQLEENVVPRRQRLGEEHLKSGKVVLLGIIPRNEALL